MSCERLRNGRPQWQTAGNSGTQSYRSTVNNDSWIAELPKGVQNGTQPFAVGGVRQRQDPAERCEGFTSGRCAEETGGEKASVEAEFSAAKSAVGSDEEEQPRKAAVDSDTGNNIDVSA